LHAASERDSPTAAFAAFGHVCPSAACAAAGAASGPVSPTAACAAFGHVCPSAACAAAGAASANVCSKATCWKYRNKPKNVFFGFVIQTENNQNRLSFGSFRFKPKIFFVCFEDILFRIDMRRKKKHLFCG
jgi:hypothetical protein